MKSQPTNYLKDTPPMEFIRDLRDIMFDGDNLAPEKLVADIVGLLDNYVAAQQPTPADIKKHIVEPKRKLTHCKYCGERLKRDVVGLYCPTHNCQWQHGVSDKEEPTCSALSMASLFWSKIDYTLKSSLADNCLCMHEKRGEITRTYVNPWCPIHGRAAAELE